MSKEKFDMSKEKFDCPACNENAYVCVVCGEVVPGWCKQHSRGRHRCDPKRLKRQDAARKAAETRLERYGTMNPQRDPSYGEMLDAGFRMLDDSNEGDA